MIAWSLAYEGYDPNPRLPPELTKLHLDLRYRGHSLAETHPWVCPPARLSHATPLSF